MLESSIEGSDVAHFSHFLAACIPFRPDELMITGNSDVYTHRYTHLHTGKCFKGFFFVVSSMSATRSDPSAHSVPSVQSAESIWTCSERTSSWLTIVHNSSPQMALIWWYTRKTVASVTEPIVWDCVRWRRSERRSHWRGWRWEVVNKFKSNQFKFRGHLPSNLHKWKS